MSGIGPPPSARLFAVFLMAGAEQLAPGHVSYETVNGNQNRALSLGEPRVFR